MTKQNICVATCKKATPFITGMLLLLSASAAQALTIDGDLNDWINAPTGIDADWSNTLRSSIHFVEEDQNTNYLNPGYGGQNYDVEAIYAERDNSNLNLAIVTGRAPGTSGWAGGDISFNFDFGSDSTSFEYGIVTQDHDGLLQGQVYAVSEWNYGIWTAPKINDVNGSSQFKSEHPVEIKSGTLLGTIDLAYSSLLYNGTSPTQMGEFSGSHYVIETRLDLAMLNLGGLDDEQFRVHWAPNCNNDYLQLDLPPADIPEPASLFLLLTGMVGLFGSRRFRQV